MNFGISFQLFIFTIHLFDFGFKLLSLVGQFFQKSRFGCEILDSFFIPGQLIFVGIHSGLIGSFLIIEKEKRTFLVFFDAFLDFSYGGIGFFFHVMQDLFVKLFETGP